MTPVVSIIIPTYNRAHLIGETLDSVIAQTFSNWECIVVDDGSKDYTNELLDFYSEKDPRIYFYHRPSNRRKGANACRNYGFELSKGKYVQWLDSDDILLQDKIEAQINLLVLTDIKAVAICKFGYFNKARSLNHIRENIKTYQNFRNGKDLLLCFGRFKEYLPLHNYLASKELYTGIGEWNEDLLINQDAEFFSRVLVKAAPIEFAETKVFYRVGNTKSTSSFDTPLKAQNAINSWKMIQQNIGDEDHLYILQAKEVLYKKLQYQYPKLIRRNLFFFKSILSLPKFLMLKIFK